MKRAWILAGSLLLALAVVCLVTATRLNEQRLPNGWRWEVNTLATRLVLPEGVAVFPANSVDSDPLAIVERIIVSDSENLPAPMTRFIDSYTYLDAVTGAVLRRSNTTIVANAIEAYQRGSDENVRFAFPRNVQPITYVIRSVEHAALPLAYEGTEDILGLQTYIFRYQGERIDDTPDRQLASGQAQICLRYEASYWVEPVTGEIVQFRQACPEGDWVVNVETNERIAPLSRYAIATSGDDLVRSVERVQDELFRIRLTTLYLPLALAVLALLCFLIAINRVNLRFLLWRFPLLNTFRVRMYVALLALAVVVSLLVIAGVRITDVFEAENRWVDSATDLRSISLQQAAFLRQLDSLDESGSSDDQFGIRNRINVSTAAFDDLLAGLRDGDEEAGIVPPTNEGFSRMLSALEGRWQEYRQSISDYIRAASAERVALLPIIDTQSQTVFTYADRLVTLVDTLVRQTREAVERTYLVVALVSVVVMGLVIVLINRALRSLTLLARTTGQFAEGNLGVRYEARSMTEIDRLGQVFNKMAAELSGFINRLRGAVKDAELARERAERSDRVKSAFLASMSHELRTPLNAIINFTRFVVDEEVGTLNADQKDMLGDSLVSARHLLNLINDVLDMSKIEAGSLTLFLEDDVDVRPLVVSASQAARALLSEKPVTVRNEIDDAIPLICADRQRVYQVLLNVVSNACKFTDAGEIVIGLRRADTEIILWVRDTGPGIAPEHHQDVFEPFKQTETGIRQGGGTGLGMPISRSLVEAHGGRMWLVSEAGSGSTFLAALPIIAKARVTAELMKVSM
jgi:signal transduction histidine kinase